VVQAAVNLDLTPEVIDALSARQFSGQHLEGLDPILGKIPDLVRDAEA
jgi:hypothetical protein